ncbi:MAG: S-layer homology domain-containing protein [Defluviitaleaceae bacterium]|nr:S-layer homology domain-containing protein [Defluviitaleaceae bacterium]
MRKRIISFVLALSMVFSLASGFALSVNALDTVGSGIVTALYNASDHSITFTATNYDAGTTTFITGVEVYDKASSNTLGTLMVIYRGPTAPGETSSSSPEGPFFVGALDPNVPHRVVVIAEPSGDVSWAEVSHEPPTVTHDLGLTVTPATTSVTQGVGGTVPVNFTIDRDGYTRSLTISANQWFTNVVVAAGNGTTASGTVNVPASIAADTNVTFTVAATPGTLPSDGKTLVNSATATLAVTAVPPVPTITEIRVQSATRPINLRAIPPSGNNFVHRVRYDVFGENLDWAGATGLNASHFDITTKDLLPSWVALGALSVTRQSDTHYVLEIPLTISLNTGDGRSSQAAGTRGLVISNTITPGAELNPAEQHITQNGTTPAPIIEEEEGGGRPRSGGIIVPGIPIDPPIVIPPPPPVIIDPTVIMGHMLFDDIRVGDWFDEAVGLVATRGLFHGTAPRVFDPQVPMSRAMFAQVLANLTGANTAAFAMLDPVFTDVQPGAWYYPAVQWGAHAGIISGIGEGLFAPDQPVTREQMADLLYRYVRANNITLQSGPAIDFTDAADISWWAAEGVGVMQRAGILGGYPDGSFRPRAASTRAEVASMFSQFLRITGAIGVEAVTEEFDDFMGVVTLPAELTEEDLAGFLVQEILDQAAEEAPGEEE